MAIQFYRGHQHPVLADFFEDFPFGLRRWPDEHMIRVEEYQEDDVYTMTAELPGFDPGKDIEIAVEGDVLTIRANRTEEKKDGKRSEFRYGSFTRSLQLPAGADQDGITADYENGLLTVTVPVGGPKEQTRKIPIGPGK